MDDAARAYVDGLDGRLGGGAGADEFCGRRRARGGADLVLGVGCSYSYGVAPVWVTIPP